MMERVHGFLPEFRFRQGKNNPRGHEFYEDLIIADTRNAFCVLAARGVGILPGKTLAETLHLNECAMRSLNKPFSPSESFRAVSCGAETSLLLFPQLLKTTELLVAARVPLPAGTVTEAVALMNGAFPISPFSARRNEEQGDSSAERLEELFYYVERIFTPDSRTGLCTLLHLIANFTGCRLEQTASVPVCSVRLSEAEWMRLVAFLLCVFLAIRHRTGAMTAWKEDAAPWEEPDNRILSLRLRMEQCPYFGTPISRALEKSVAKEHFLDALPEDIRCFAQHAAFRKFSILETKGGGLTFGMALDTESRISSVATVPAVSRLRLMLEMGPLGENSNDL